MTGSVSRSKNDPSQSLQMTERPLDDGGRAEKYEERFIYRDENRCASPLYQSSAVFKGGFFLKTPIQSPTRALAVHYISRETLIKNITARYPQGKETACSYRKSAVRRSDDDRACRGNLCAGSQSRGTAGKKLRNRCGQVKAVYDVFISKSSMKTAICRTAQSWCTSIFTTEWTKNERRPGIKTIAQDLSISRSTVKRAIKDLEKARSYERAALP